MAATTLNNATRVAAWSLALFCVSLLITAYSSRNPETSYFGQYVLSELSRPIQSVVEDSFSSTGKLWANYVDLISTREENQELKERIASLESQNAKLTENLHENKRLKTLLGIVENTDFKGLLANVIGYNPSNWVKSITIDKGAADGIANGMAVIDSQGIVGQVIHANRRSSEVLLVTDHASGIDAIVQRNRARGVVEGSGGRLARLRYVLKESELEIGDRIISSGMDGIFPKGLLIGIISDLGSQSSGHFHTVQIRPTVDFSRIESVFIITEWSQVESNSKSEMTEAVTGATNK